MIALLINCSILVRRLYLFVMNQKLMVKKKLLLLLINISFLIKFNNYFNKFYYIYEIIRIFNGI